MDSGLGQFRVLDGLGHHFSILKKCLVLGSSPKITPPHHGSYPEVHILFHSIAWGFLVSKHPAQWPSASLDCAPDTSNKLWQPRQCMFLPMVFPLVSAQISRNLASWYEASKSSNNLWSDPNRSSPEELHDSKNVESAGDGQKTKAMENGCPFKTTFQHRIVK
jgi:hypothetical protein